MVLLDVLFLLETINLVEILEALFEDLAIDSMLLIESQPSLLRNLLDFGPSKVTLSVFAESDEGDE